MQHRRDRGAHDDAVDVVEPLVEQLEIGGRLVKKADASGPKSARQVLADPNVSRRHAEIRPSGDGFVLVDLASSRPSHPPGAGLRGLIEAVLEEALEAGEVLDAAVAESEAQRAALWRIREEHPEAQRREGASVKNDVSAGDTVTLTIYRGGQYYAVDVILMDQALQ